MRYLQVSKRTLDKAGYSPPKQASSYFPKGNQTEHIHLGTPTSYRDGDQQKFAEDGNVFASFISFKRDDAIWFRMNHNSADGYFSFPAGHSANELPDSWVDALRALGVVRGL
jgi:hypothetical protein